VESAIMVGQAAEKINSEELSFKLKSENVMGLCGGHGSV